jgi:hypothetical protein
MENPKYQLKIVAFNIFGLNMNVTNKDVRDLLKKSKHHTISIFQKQENGTSAHIANFVVYKKLFDDLNADHIICSKSISLSLFSKECEIIAPFNKNLDCEGKILENCYLEDMGVDFTKFDSIDKIKNSSGDIDYELLADLAELGLEWSKKFVEDFADIDEPIHVDSFAIKQYFGIGYKNNRSIYNPNHEQFKQNIRREMNDMIKPFQKIVNYKNVAFYYDSYKELEYLNYLKLSFNDAIGKDYYSDYDYTKCGILFVEKSKYFTNIKNINTQIFNALVKEFEDKKAELDKKYEQRCIEIKEWALNEGANEIFLLDKIQMLNDEIFMQHREILDMKNQINNHRII